MNVLRMMQGLAGLVWPSRKFGFTQGQHYLNETDIVVLRELVGAADVDAVTARFEAEFSKIIGSGQAVSFASGRMAFYSLLKVLGVGSGDEVILPGFTCAVMATAVMRTGAKPVFSDISQDTLGSSPLSVIKNITPRTKVIVAQHSFGIPCEIAEICAIGREKGLFIVEDCAICLDSKNKGVIVGNFGDAAVFSTDHTKPLNTLIGGLIYTRDEALAAKVREIAKSAPCLAPEHQKNLFRRFELEQRFVVPEKYSRVVLSNYVRALLRRFSAPLFLEGDYSASSSADYPYPARIPVFLAKLGLFELRRWKAEALARRKLLEMYISGAKKAGMADILPKAYSDSSLEITPLRFVFLYPDRKGLFSKMQLIDTDSTWFTAPLACSVPGPESLGYVPGSCPVAEAACDTIVNWPTSVPGKYHVELAELLRQSLSIG